MDDTLQSIVDPATLTAKSARIIWDGLPEKLQKKIGDAAWGKWAEFRWQHAAHRYLERIIDMLGTTRLLGNPKPIPIEQIYTDVFVLPKITAKRRYDIAELEKLTIKELREKTRSERKPALQVVGSETRIYVLGKPGAGKTTFLKYLAISAAKGNLTGTPIFVSLKEWSDSKSSLRAFMEKQFEICGFPDAGPVIESLLEEGKAIVLFDGLDEVTQVGHKRRELITEVTSFAVKYGKCKICVTCRTAAEDYAFERFTYVEVADFEPEQQIAFVKKWYHGESDKLARFLGEWKKQENAGFRDLAETPLLLALLCLAFDETLDFPERKVDLYKEALDALLKKWDSSRSIFRDTVYKKLSLSRKEQVLSRLAADTFKSGRYIFRSQVATDVLKEHLSEFPPSERADYPDLEAVLQSIEAQHGILIQRAVGLYSFSHLTFHEYFCARYMVENAGKGALTELAEIEKLLDSRWREVILQVASLIDNAEAYLAAFSSSMHSIVQADYGLVQAFAWIESAAASGRTSIGSDPVPFLRSPGPMAIADHSRALEALEEKIYLAPKLLVERLAPPSGKFENRAVKRARLLDGILSKHSDRFMHFLSEKQGRAMRFAQYMAANLLYADCLALAVCGNRKAFEDEVLNARDRTKAKSH